MTFWITLGLYVVAMLFLWGYFIVAIVHVFKFKDYSRHVAPVTRALGIFLAILTVVGFVAIVRMDSSSGKSVKMSEMAVTEEY